jgi:hypothetical protein
MARDNRRKREAKRFGVAERLADLIVAHGLKVPEELEGGNVPPGYPGLAEWARLFVAEKPKIVASNVAEYMFATCPKEEWVDRDFPSSIPPFDGLFIEFQRPSRVAVGSLTLGGDPQSLGFPGRFDAGR